MDISSNFVGLSFTQRDLMDMLAKEGWEIHKIEPKDDGFIVNLNNIDSEKWKSDPASSIEQALAQSLLEISNQRLMCSAAYHHTWVHQLKPIARAYAQAPIFDHKAAPSWKALADDNIARLPYIEQTVKPEFTYDSDPYEDGDALSDDVKKGKLKVPLEGIENHPIWTPDQVLAHRICHSVLGHAPNGANFDWAGANAATLEHFPYLSNAAKRALFTSEVGRKAYQTQSNGYAPEKIAHLNDFLGNEADSSVAPENTIVPWGSIVI